MRDTVRLHPGSVDTNANAADAQVEVMGETYTTYNWTNLFTDNITTRVGRERVTRSVASIYLWTPLLNSIFISIFACFGAILYGGVFAYLVTRTNLKLKKYLSSIFIFPYIMPQWTLAVMWQNLFNSNVVTGGNRCGGARASSRCPSCWRCTTRRSPTSSSAAFSATWTPTWRKRPPS